VIAKREVTRSSARLATCIVTLASMGSLGVSARVQSDEGLARLTVPARLLPGTCRLEPVIKDANGKTTFAMYPGVRENPWIGTRQPTVAIVRRVIEGEPREYDDLTGPQRLERGAIGTVDAYLARYLADDGGKVHVSAVRFVDHTLTLRAAARRLGDEIPRIVFGSTAALVSYSRPTTRVKGTAATDACYEAVRKYIGTLK
jgi:hypothetical protein